MTRQGSKQFGTEMPDVLFVIDNDYEQRYYRSPEAMAKGMSGWLDDKNGRVHAYRRIDTDSDGNAGAILLTAIAERDKHDAAIGVEFNKVVGPQGYQPTPAGEVAWTAWNKIDAKLHKAKVAAIAAVLAAIR
jgi:hypothetical protein